MKTKRTGLIAIAWMALFAAPAVGPAPALAQTGHDLFQQALVKEQAEGDLRAAIALYQRIVEKFAADRGLAARALVQMGQCHERLGSQEAQAAQAAYRQVLQEYADQAEEAEQARARLAALNRPSPTVAPSGIQVRRLMSGHYPDFVDLGGGPTPDGRGLVYIDWDTGNLAVQDLQTGASRLITNISEEDYQTGYPSYVLVSPRGDRLAYPWLRTEASGQGSEESVVDLRVVKMDGSDLRSHEGPPDLWPECWSTDGRHIAAVVGGEGDSVREIQWVSVEDWSTIPLGDIEYPVGRMSPSNDDRFLAIQHPVEEDPARNDISLVATDGSGIQPLIHHPADDKLIGWVPGTNDLLFSSDRSGNWDLWAIQITEEGRPGEPHPVRRGIGEQAPMGFTRDGSLFYSVYTLQDNIIVAPFDEGTGRISLEGSKPLGGVGSNMRPSWSPAGNHLAFVRRRPAIPGRGFGESGYEEILYVRDLRNGEERPLAEDIAPATVGAPVWFPDGHSLLMLGMPQELSGGSNWGEVPSTAYRVDFPSGEATALFEFPPDQSWWAGIGIIPTPDGKGVLYAHQGRLVHRDLASGREEELYRSPGLVVGILHLSPDGSELVFAVNDSGGGSTSLRQGARIMVMPSQGGAARTLTTIEGPGRAGAVSWSSDGEYVDFWQIEESRTRALMRVPREGGNVERLWGTQAEIGKVVRSPEGRQIAYIIRENEAEVWVMENLVAALEELKTGR